MKPFKPFRFLDWKVYRDSQEMFFIVHAFVKQLPREYRYEIGSQAIRASLSVVLNIAEGGGKFSSKDTNRFLDIAMGSLYETRALLDTVSKDPSISTQTPTDIVPRIEEIGRQLGGLRKSISAKSKLHP